MAARNFVQDHAGTSAELTRVGDGDHVVVGCSDYEHRKLRTGERLGGSDGVKLLERSSENAIAPAATIGSRKRGPDGWQFGRPALPE